MSMIYQAIEGIYRNAGEAYLSGIVSYQHRIVSKKIRF